MKSLSQTVENIITTATAPNAIQNTSSPGSISGDGRMSILIQSRNKPLMENELTQIASKLLRKMPVLSSTKRKIYGQKTLIDDYGSSYVVDDEPIGEEDCYELSILVHEKIDAKVIESALRASPPSATLSHLQRLAMHKRLGSSDTDRGVLLHDYAEALRPYSEFVIYVACKSLWEGDDSPFYPKIKPLVELCEQIHLSFTALHANAGLIAAPAKAPRLQREENTQRGQDERRAICDFLVSKGEPDWYKSHSYSNYQLELLAGKHGWNRPTSSAAWHGVAPGYPNGGDMAEASENF